MELTPLVPLPDVLDLVLDTVVVVDADGHFLYLSPSCERLLGYRPEELIGRNMIDLVHPDDRARTLARAGDIMAGQPSFVFENRYLRKDGSVVDIAWSARRSEEGRVRVAVARDITERKRAQARTEALLAISEAAHTADDVLALCERIHGIIQSLLPTREFAIIARARNGELETHFHDGNDQAMPTVLAMAERLVRNEQPVLQPDSGGTWLGVPLRGQHGLQGALVLQASACSHDSEPAELDMLQFVSAQVAAAIERKQLNARLQHLAHHDELTGLPNRTLLHDRLDTALARVRRERSGMVLLFLDLDHFKQINDTHGHAAGDAVLRATAQRLSACVRESDTVARFSGDEFVLLLEQTRSAADAELVAGKIRAALATPIEFDGAQLPIGASIGWSVYPTDGDSARMLLRHADHAMYAAKQAR
ncbi:MAG: diguanylate cyclase domain-containing protein [Telluria sp.]